MIVFLYFGVKILSRVVGRMENGRTEEDFVHCVCVGAVFLSSVFFFYFFVSFGVFNFLFRSVVLVRFIFCLCYSSAFFSSSAVLLCFSLVVYSRLGYSRFLVILVLWLFLLFRYFIMLTLLLRFGYSYSLG